MQRYSHGGSSSSSQGSGPGMSLAAAAPAVAAAASRLGSSMRLKVMGSVQGTNFVTCRALDRCSVKTYAHIRRQQQLQLTPRWWLWQQQQQHAAILPMLQTQTHHAHMTLLRPTHPTLFNRNGLDLVTWSLLGRTAFTRNIIQKICDLMNNQDSTRIS